MLNSSDTNQAFRKEEVSASWSLFSPRNELTIENSDLPFTNQRSSATYTNKITDNFGISDAEYNHNLGYGLVSAAEAVGKALGNNGFPNVPSLGGQEWSADLVQAPEVWSEGYTGKGVIVAVLDTGVDYQHSDLNGNIWTNTKEIASNGIDDDLNGYIDDVSGWNFHDGNNDILDRNSHGTHVSGIIAGEKNGFGVTGIAYDAQIMPVKVLGDSGSGYYDSISNGIRYAVDNGANIINLSLGGKFPANNIAESLEYANSMGVVVVMSAGNYGESKPCYPGLDADKWGLVVGAVDQNNQLADFSNRAGSNDLAYVTAPGVQVYSTIPNNEYDFYSGTSMASPHVAGVVALMLNANSNLTPDRVRQIIIETSGNNAHGIFSNTRDVSGYLSNNEINNEIEMIVHNHNPSFNNAPSDYQLLNSGESINQIPNLISAFPGNIIGDTIKRFLYNDNEDNSGKEDNDMSCIIKDITEQLQPYQQLLNFFF
ncbi:Alkaline protease precursor [Richelia intracellularis HH01]|uniref:Alkaline protease n=1 Tax=Richelia intracellularis HH01 TaxID=1165094 RepID=M1WTN7_9NOST|nr:S8 family peptidase [Richelia intracellularis]CCH68229.1 Alkaline protease precursor [Richelia intracellularis HH01]